MVEKNSRIMPLVSRNTYVSFLEEFTRTVDGDLSDKIVKRLDLLKEENPNVADYIKRLAEYSEDPGKVMSCGIVVYKLIEKQLEVEKQKKQFK